MKIHYFNELTTTVSQVILITIYAVIAGLQLLKHTKKDPMVSTAFVWFLLVRHVVTFVALLFFSFPIFIGASFIFILITCIDVGNFYENIPETKDSLHRLNFIKIRIPRMRHLQLILFFVIDIAVWWLIMFSSELVKSTTLWNRVHIF